MRTGLIVVFIASLLMLPVVQVAYAETLTVKSGEDYYGVGSLVSITGTAVADASVAIIVHVNSIRLYEVEVNADSTGGFKVTYLLPSNATIGVYTVTASSGTLSSEISFTVTANAIGEVARQLIEAAEGAQALSGGIMRDLLALGYAVPQAANSEMTQGQNAVAEANSLHLNGLYSDSAEAAHRAMSHYKNALALALGEAEGYEYTPSQRESLTHRLEVLDDRLSQLSELVSNLAEDDVNRPALNSLIELAEASLNLALSKIGEGSYDEADQALTDSQGDIQEAMQLINSNLNHYRSGLTAQFASRLRERVNASSADLDQLSDHIQASYMTAVRQRLGEANGLTAQAENHLQQGLNEDAIVDLEEASNRFRLGLNELGNSDLSEGLLQLDMIRCQIQVRKGLAERLRLRDQDASIIEAEIQGLTGLVDEGMRKIQMGDYSGAVKLMGDAMRGGQYNGSGQGGGGSGQGSGGGR